jgi:hypothetical protein
MITALIFPRIFFGLALGFLIYAQALYPKSAKTDKGFQGFLKFLYGTRFGRMIAMMRIHW